MTGGDPCPECGAALELSSGPGRTRSYRGGDGYEIPSELTYPVCPSCGAVWMTSEQVTALSDALERQRVGRAVGPGPSNCDHDPPDICAGPSLCDLTDPYEDP